MYSASVTLTANATSIRSLIATALSGEIPDNSSNAGATFGGPLANSGFDGRCIVVQISVPSAGSTVLSSRGNFNPPAAPPANNGVTLPPGTVQPFSAVTANQISIDEMFLSGTATGVGIFILVA